MKTGARNWLGAFSTIVILHVNRIGQFLTISPMRVADFLLAGLLIGSASLLFLAGKIENRSLRITARIFSWFTVVLSIFRLVFLVFAMQNDAYRGDWWGSNGDSSFELIRSEPVDGGEIRAYRTNGGAMTSFGVVVRHEASLGIVNVSKVLSSQNHCYGDDELDFKLRDGNKLHLSLCATAGDFVLSRWVYF